MLCLQLLGVIFLHLPVLTVRSHGSCFPTNCTFPTTKNSAAEWQIWNGAPRFSTSRGLQAKLLETHPVAGGPTMYEYKCLHCSKFRSTTSWRLPREHIFLPKHSSHGFCAKVDQKGKNMKKHFKQHIFIADLSWSWFMCQLPGFGSRTPSATHKSKLSTALWAARAMTSGLLSSCWWTCNPR